MGKLGMTVLLLLIITSPISAHRMIIDPVSTGIYRVLFDDGTAAANVQVIVYDEQDAIIKEVITDGNGLAHIVSPHFSWLLASDGMGHIARFIPSQENRRINRPLNALLGVILILMVGFGLNWLRDRKVPT